MTANLTVEESAFEAEECEGANVPESSYARRKRRTEDSLHQQKVSDKKQQIAIMKEIMSTPENGSTASTTSNDTVNDCVDNLKAICRRIYCGVWRKHALFWQRGKD